VAHTRKDALGRRAQAKHSRSGGAVSFPDGGMVSFADRSGAAGSARGSAGTDDAGHVFPDGTTLEGCAPVRAACGAPAIFALACDTAFTVCPTLEAALWGHAQGSASADLARVGSVRRPQVVSQGPAAAQHC